MSKQDESGMRHVFFTKQLGWDGPAEGIWFDSEEYTEKEAKAQFKEYVGTTQKGYPYKGYEFEGDKFYSVEYIGEFPANDMPSDDFDPRVIEKRRNK